MILDRHANLKYKYENWLFGCRGYYVDTVGKNTEKIKAYIQNQLNEDIMTDNIRSKNSMTRLRVVRINKAIVLAVACECNTIGEHIQSVLRCKPVT